MQAIAAAEVFCYLCDCVLINKQIGERKLNRDDEREENQKRRGRKKTHREREKKHENYYKLNNRTYNTYRLASRFVLI